MHKLTVIGRLGQDPEMRYMPNGNAVTSFSVASDNPRGDNKNTEWIRCAAFGKLAEVANQYLSKGSQVYLDGPFHTHSYETTQGETRFNVELVVNNMHFLDSAERNGNGERVPATAKVLEDNRPPGYAIGDQMEPDEVEDLPF